MRLVTLRTGRGIRVARLEADRGIAVELDAPDVGSLLAAGPPALEAARRATGREHDAATLDLAPLVPRPGKFLCVGLNYAAHAKESGVDLPKYPSLFVKFPESLIGARDPIVLPRVSDRVDWEVELAFVIGKRVRHVSPEEAVSAIAGFTVCNDVSVRDFQFHTSQLLPGKTFESTTPLGPALVTPDEVDGGLDLQVRCEVDGQVVQDSRTSDLIFRPAEIVSYVSQIITLQPGDVFSTGTPAGVGLMRDPPVFLRPGQRVRTWIEGVGELLNECVAEG